MPVFLDLTGKTFGLLTVVSRAPKKNRYTQWICKCKCGKEAVVYSTNLMSGSTNSCGCIAKKRATKHGMSDKPLYSVWRVMLNRCCNPKVTAYKSYGGQGVKVCSRWNPKEGGSFANFMDDMPDYPGKPYGIVRLDHTRGYEPGNCRWATPQEQNLIQRKRSKLTAR
jgi:hypothetical protein